MSLKELAQTARDLGIVADGLDRAEIEKEIDEVAQAQSVKIKTPLEWLQFEATIAIPLNSFLSSVALANPTAFSYQSKAAEKRAAKATDGKEIIAEMNDNGRKMLEKKAGELPLAQRLVAAVPLSFKIHSDDKVFEEMFPKSFGVDALELPVSSNPISIKVIPGKKSPVTLQTTSGGLVTQQVIDVVREQLTTHWNSILASEEAEGLKEFEAFEDKGSSLSAKFVFHRIGSLYYFKWLHTPIAGKKRPREE